MKKFIFTVFILIFCQAFGQNCLFQRGDWKSESKGPILASLESVKVGNSISKTDEIVLCPLGKLMKRPRANKVPSLLELAAGECCKYDNVLDLMEETNKGVMSYELNTYFVRNWIEKNYHHLINLVLKKSFKPETLIECGSISDSIAFLPDGNIVTVFGDKTVRISNVKTGECVHTLAGHDRDIMAIDSFLDGKVVTGSSDGTAKIWDVNTEKCLHTLQADNNMILSVKVLPDGTVLTGSFDGTAKIWDVNTEKCLHTLTGHGMYIYQVEALSGGRVVTVSGDKTAKIWNSKTGECLHTLVGHAEGVNNVDVLPDGTVLTGSLDGTAKIWDVNTGECLGTFTINGKKALLENGVLVGFGKRNIEITHIDQRINDLISDNGNVTLGSLRRVKRLIEESNSSAAAASSSAS